MKGARWRSRELEGRLRRNWKEESEMTKLVGRLRGN